MAPSVLLSRLSTQARTMDVAAFRAAYPNHWVVWEAGKWEPPRASTVQISKEQLQRIAAAAGESLAMGLDDRGGGLQQRTLGRGEGCDLVINDGTVSERHVVFTREADGWNVRDSASRNGTLLNGSQLMAGQPQRLSNGAQLQVGQVHLTYYTPEGMYARAMQFGAG